MNARLRQRARELGFDDCRFTTAAPPETAPHFRQWLAEGLHGTMGYLPRQAARRADPQRVLRGARSIITLAASYAGVESLELRVESSCGSASQLSTLNSQPSGLVARYARFTDYHDVLGARLAALAGFVDETGGPGTRSLCYVDTGPILERDLAQRAGLGFTGKHTNLISRRLGNWILLAEILTTLELEPDAPEKNRCGSCTRCLTACPTQAITAPFQLDARRCLSYLTIEFKGPIPPEFRAALGDRIYGCDDCLAVCPWNRFAAEGRLMREHARPDLARPDLLELLALDEAGFQHRFAGTPLLRTGRRGLRRNVCVALGNVGDHTALPALDKTAAEPDALLAEHARWAMAQIARRTGPGARASAQ